jgi:hypothetical protein
MYYLSESSVSVASTPLLRVIFWELILISWNPENWFLSVC